MKACLKYVALIIVLLALIQSCFEDSQIKEDLIEELDSQQEFQETISYVGATKALEEIAELGINTTKYDQASSYA